MQAERVESVNRPLTIAEQPLPAHAARGSQPMFTLGAAARHLNISKGTLSRAVKDGKLSAQRLDNGSLAIDPSELQRYSDAHANRSSNALEERSTTPDGDTIELRARLDLAEQRLADLRELVHDLKD